MNEEVIALVFIAALLDSATPFPPNPDHRQEAYEIVVRARLAGARAQALIEAAKGEEK